MCKTVVATTTGVSKNQTIQERKSLISGSLQQQKFRIACIKRKWNEMTATLFSASVRSALNRWFVLVLLVTLTLTLAGGYVTYDSHVDGAETVTEQQTVGTWTVESGFEHGATVSRDTEVFSAGERLRNRSLYFTTASPELDGTYTVSHDNTEGNAAVTSTNLSLVIRAVEERNGNQVVHWQTRDSLDTLDAVEIADGETATTTVSVDIPQSSTVPKRYRTSGGCPRTDRGPPCRRYNRRVVGQRRDVHGTRTDRIEIVPGRVSTALALPQPESPLDATSK